MLRQQVISRDCWNIQPMFVPNLASAKLPFTGCLQPKHPATEDTLTNSGVRIYSKISGRCLTRTCTWTCFWKGNCIVKSLVPTSRQQCLHVLNRCVESSSFKWNLNHLSMSSLPTSYKQLWSFPLTRQYSLINPSLVWAKAGQLFSRCCTTIYGDKGKLTSSSLFAVLVLLRKNNNTIVPSKITLVPLSLPLENLKTEK